MLSHERIHRMKNGKDGSADQPQEGAMTNDDLQHLTRTFATPQQSPDPMMDSPQTARIAATAHLLPFQNTSQGFHIVLGNLTSMQLQTLSIESILQLTHGQIYHFLV